MRVGEAQEQARRSAGPHETAPNDVRLLMAEALGRPVTWVLSHPEAPLSPTQQDRFDRSLNRYLVGEPLPYILGWWEFYGRRFAVAPSVLIPRPETESLVERVLSFLRENPDRLDVVDVGAGSGCIAVTLAAECPSCRVTAIDISEAALRLAHDNARAHGVEPRICWLQNDLLPVRTAWDVVVGNLPYVPSRRAQGGREPKLALDGGDDGLVPLRRLIDQLPQALRPGGFAALEIDEGQGHEVAARAQTLLPEADIEIDQDLAGRERFLLIRRNTGT
ncbi:MAG TPA: peptide chain release factor N(5)-glutamine methyltransferase [Anaerolineales bacterium]|nr:peptide chain release factor N(5)-glutamine methyltransferase [Anaerolineales bacterium]